MSGRNVDSSLRAPLEPLDIEPGFALTVGRFLSYKHIDAVVAAIGDDPNRRLVVVGTGPEESELRRNLPSNVMLLGSVTDSVLRWLYSNALCLVSSAHEDFGLTPVEAAMFGTPSVLLRKGGFVESMVEGTTAIYFDEVTPVAIREALRQCDGHKFSRDEVRRDGEQFSQAGFAQRFQAIVNTMHSPRQLSTI